MNNKENRNNKVNREPSTPNFQSPYQPKYFPFVSPIMPTTSPLNRTTYSEYEPLVPKPQAPLSAKKSQAPPKAIIFKQHVTETPSFMPQPLHCKSLIIDESESHSPRNPFYDYSGLQFSAEQLRSGYYSTPSCKELHRLLMADHKAVFSELLVGRKDVGTITFRNVTLRHVVLRELKIEKSCISLETNCQIGMGLNTQAIIQIVNVKPPPQMPLNNFRVKVEQMTKELGGTLTNYDPTTGDWIFRVDHF